jgi:microsomal dipeptidase-like Zn-dependent dipeptidase
MFKLFVSILAVLLATAPTHAQLTDAEVEAKKQALMQGIDGRTAEERERDKVVMARYSSAVVIDALIPGTPNGYVGGPISVYEEMVSRSKDHGFDAVSYTAAIDDTYEPLQIVQWIGMALRYWNSKPDVYRIVDTVDDIHAAKKDGKLAVTLNFQGSNALGSRLEMVDVYYKLGVRQMNFAYNVRNFMSDGGGVSPDRDSGLSKMGFQLVREMNRVGMIVDCTHSSNNACLDAAGVSTKPIMLSHSNAYGAYELPRNSPDDVLKAVAGTGGVICTNGLGGFLNKEGNARPEDLARHINYVKELVGAEHTCFGSDHLTTEVYIEALDFVLRNPASYPPELGYGAQTQIALPRDIWGVVAVLEDKYGWSNKEIRGFLGENLLRLYEANWE